MKKLLFFVCVLLCVFCVSSVSCAEEFTCDEYECVLLPDGTAEILAYNGIATNLTIPKTLNGIHVTSIGECAFFFNSDLQTVELPAGITTLKWMAFAGCNNLTSITLPETTVEIDPSAFSNCDNLTVSAIEGSYAEAYCQSNGIPHKTITNCFVTFGHYEQDGNYSNGKEEVEWIVLDIQDNKALLLSRYTLDCQYYNLEACNWDESYLRAWLNNVFLNEAFSSQERTAILNTLVDNSSVHDMEGLPFTDMGTKFNAASTEKHTFDQIFLLSFQEVLSYFPSEAERCCNPTAYVTGKRGFDEEELEGRYGLVVSGGWWLRGNGLNIEGSDGTVYWAEYAVKPSGQASCTYASDSAVGVRPALWVDLSAVSTGIAVTSYTPAPIVTPKQTETPAPTPAPTSTPEPTSTPIAVTMVTVPGVYAMEQHEAANLLTNSGLDFQVYTHELHTDVSPYYVIGQSIASGSEVPFNTIVMLELGYMRDILHTTSAKGLLSDVKVTFAVNDDLSIASIVVDCSGETAAFAAPCAEEEFLSQFIGEIGPFYDIDVVTGATNTSNAIAEALNQYFEAVLPSEAFAEEPIGYYWADYQIILEDWTLSPAILNQPLKNCTGFTYTLYLDNIQSGTPFGDWTLYGETLGGTWVKLESFTAPSTVTTVDIALVSPMDIYSLCSVRKLHTECTHTYAYEIANPRYAFGIYD